MVTDPCISSLKVCMTLMGDTLIVYVEETMTTGFAGIVLLEKNFVIWDERCSIHIQCSTYHDAVILFIKQWFIVLLLCTSRFG